MNIIYSILIITYIKIELKKEKKEKTTVNQ